MLSLLEGSHRDTALTGSTGLLALDAVAIAVYTWDAVSYWTWGRTLTGSGQTTKGVTKATLVTLFWLDWVLRVSTGYNTGPPAQRLPVPYSSVLRPVYIVASFPRLRHAMGDFAITMWDSRAVLLLAFITIVCGSVTALALLRSVIRA